MWSVKYNMVAEFSTDARQTIKILSDEKKTSYHVFGETNNLERMYLTTELHVTSTSINSWL